MLETACVDCDACSGCTARFMYTLARTSHALGSADEHVDSLTPSTNVAWQTKGSTKPGEC